MSESLDKQRAEAYRKLIPFLPSDIVLNDQLSDCQRNRGDQSRTIANFGEYLEKEGIIDPGWSKHYKDECLLQAEWSGVYDFLDKGSDERKAMTKPSIGWTCQPLECHIESDLPIPADAMENMKGDIKKVGHCCITEVHEHEEIHTRDEKTTKLTFIPEKHVHVVCKGIHPNDLGWSVNQLVKAVLKGRGHKLNPIEELKY